MTAVSNARSYGLAKSNVVLKFYLIDSTSTCEHHFSNIQWMHTTEKGSEILNTSFSVNSRYKFSDDLLSLNIANLQEADDGNYTLMATNDLGKSSATYNLTIHSKGIYMHAVALYSWMWLYYTIILLIMLNCTVFVTHSVIIV